jgi:hypothetical protein
VAIAAHQLAIFAPQLEKLFDDFMFARLLLMRSHLLSMLEPASILQVNRHAGRGPGVTPDRSQKPSVARTFANGCPAIVISAE